MTWESYIAPHRGAAWRRVTRRAGFLVLGSVLAASSGCTDAARNGSGDSFLVISTLQGTSGLSGTPSAILSSDVVNVDPATGATSIAADSGQVSFQLVMKDQGGPGPSPVNAITLTQYHVDYVRSDGRNTPGVDVPFGFDGGMTLTVQGTGSTSFTLVRIQAKQEAPLRALRFGGSANVISTVARVTFYGHDQAGRDVSVTGNIEVNFSDWADE